MEIIRGNQTTGDSASPVSTQLPPALLEKAADRLCWITILCAVSTILLFALEQWLQPELNAMADLASVRLSLLGVFLLAGGFFAVQRNGWVKKQTLLDLGIVFQVYVAFAISMLETSRPWKDDVVLGHSAVAIWLSICGLVLPNVPLKAGMAAILSACAWPAAYYLNLSLYGFDPLPLNRLAIWLFPNFLMAIWMYILNKRMFQMQITQVKAEELGSYQLDYLIGKGGMGEVWRARHKMLARDAAIKLIRADVLAGVNARQENVMRKRFEREARATASLRSPHTVALFDFGRTKDNTFYYVMELLDGIDLQSLVERYGPLQPGRVINILIQVAESLEEAHRAGLVHRDIKPRNLILAKMGMQYDFSKVLDFGLVKTNMVQDASMMTLDGVATGTPAYLPPEIALGESKIDGRADLYSLGCVAHYLLTGQLVFSESTPTALALAHVQKPVVPLSERTELPIPPALEMIVMQLLEKKPENRPRSAQDLQRRLRAIAHEMPAFTHDDAADWWHTNLPETAARVQPRLEDSTPANSEITEPLAVQNSARS
ncbi:MAG: serine/threonine-protein kinase [Acidobacteria bacterium]|nr:serine/threonine-protein kinase [Acidobacteriota bacterium]